MIVWVGCGFGHVAGSTSGFSRFSLRAERIVPGRSADPQPRICPLGFSRPCGRGPVD